jgi:hypothetical protein
VFTRRDGPSSPADASWRTAAAIAAGTVAACVLSLAKFTPTVWLPDYAHYSLGRYSMARTETARVPLLLAQLRDPVHWDRFTWADGVPVDPLLANGNALRWRLLLPTVGHALRLPPVPYLALAWVGLAALLAAVAYYGYRVTGEVRATVALMSLATTTSVFFIATGWLGQFDAFYVLGLVAFCFSPSTTVLVAACALAPWVDERFLLLVPACACARWALYPDRRRQLWSMTAILPYVAARVAAVALGDDSFCTQVGLQTVSFSNEVKYCVSYLPLGLIEGFRAGWIVVAAGAMLLWSRCGGRAERAGLAVAALTGLGATFFLAWDSSRSAAVLMPLLVLGTRRPWIRRALPWLALLNLVLPAAHVYGDAYLPLHCFLAR